VIALFGEKGEGDERRARGVAILCGGKERKQITGIAMLERVAGRFS
jgi:hypothetical protein